MLKTVPSQQRSLNWFRLTNTLTPLTLGVALLTATGLSVEARPVFVQPASCSTSIIGSPIPSPVPMNPVTGQPCAFSPYSPVITPGRGVIRNSTLINPTVINSRVSNSVLVNPVIINSPRSPYGIVRPPVIYNQPGVRIRINP
jgi:hypothetical protein